jgi:hypothetical protein
MDRPGPPPGDELIVGVVVFVPDVDVDVPLVEVVPVELVVPDPVVVVLVCAHAQTARATSVRQEKRTASFTRTLRSDCITDSTRATGRQASPAR